MWIKKIEALAGFQQHPGAVGAGAHGCGPGPGDDDGGRVYAAEQ
jgi:hypothetical protein